jgi:hypothetical protein
MMVSTKTTSTTEVPEFAVKIREQLISTVKQCQQFSVDAAQTWMKAASVLPVADLPTIPGVAALPDAEVVTKFAFDFANDLLKAQRDFTLQLANALVPEKLA